MARPATRPLHVLTLTPFFPSRENPVGGCFVKEPLDFLQTEGVTSTVIAASPLHHHKKEPALGAPAEWFRYPQIPGTIGLASAGRLLAARLSRRVADLHRRKPVDLIHAHAALPCGEAARQISRRLTIPYVVSVHGLDVFNTCYVEGWAAEGRRRASAAVYQDANAVVCISERAQEILRSGMRGGVRSCVIYNGADPDLFSPGAGAHGHRAENGDVQQELLVVGNLIASKGQELLLRAMHRLAGMFPQMQCRVVGEGPDRTRLQALATQLELGQRVQFVSRQSRTEIADAMRRCSIFVLPSRNEGLGCVYLEAMACGRPVVGCRGQGIEEIIEHGKNGWLVSGSDTEELAGALTTLLREPDLAAQIGRAARETIVNGLTLSHQAHNLAMLYRAAGVPGAADRGL